MSLGAERSNLSGGWMKQLTVRSTHSRCAALVVAAGLAVLPFAERGSSADDTPSRSVAPRARDLKPAKSPTNMVWVPGGSFTMGTAGEWANSRHCSKAI
jgi:formylglycine-generating enzyme required for sulfatase activity